MGKLVYNIRQAAKATGASELSVGRAIRKGKLVAHRVDDKAVILREDLKGWVRSHPDYLAAD